jgi:hypothetical protein
MTDAETINSIKTRDAPTPWSACKNAFNFQFLTSNSLTRYAANTSDVTRRNLARGGKEDFNEAAESS